MAKPSQLHDCIHGLAATTFVQAVEAPHLAIIVPLLNRGLQDRVQAIQRKACLIADNMAKLVDDELHAAPFLPSVMPLVKRVSEEVADPEVRNVASKALKTLQRIEKDAAEISKVCGVYRHWLDTAKLAHLWLASLPSAATRTSSCVAARESSLRQYSHSLEVFS